MTFKYPNPLIIIMPITYKNKDLSIEDVTEFPSAEYKKAKDRHAGNCTGPPSNCYGGHCSQSCGGSCGIPVRHIAKKK